MEEIVVEVNNTDLIFVSEQNIMKGFSLCQQDRIEFFRTKYRTNLLEKEE